MPKEENWQQYLENRSTEDLEKRLAFRYNNKGKQKHEVDGLTQLFTLITSGIITLIILVAWPLALTFGAFIWIFAAVLALVPMVFLVIFLFLLIGEVIKYRKQTQLLKILLVRSRPIK